MAALRVIVNLSPVGPWQSLAAADPVWFAVQLSAATDVEPADADRRNVAAALLPWNLLRGGWDEAAGIGPTDLAFWLVETAPAADVKTPPNPVASQAPAQNDFAWKQLLPAVAAHYADDAVLDDYALAFAPGHVDPNVASAAKPPLGSALHGMATLPGPVASALGATVYVSLTRAQLTAASATATRLVIVPRRLYNLTQGAAPVALSSVAGVYAKHATPQPNLDVYTATYGATLTVSTPGFDLALLAAPPDQPFDLAHYWMPVSAPARPLLDLDATLDDVLDPVAELHDTTVFAALSTLEADLADGTRRAVHTAEVDTLWWRWLVDTAIDALDRPGLTGCFIELLRVLGLPGADAAVLAPTLYAKLSAPPPAMTAPAGVKQAWLCDAFGLPEDPASPLSVVAAAVAMPQLADVALALFRSVYEGPFDIAAERRRALADHTWRHSRAFDAAHAQVRAAAAIKGSGAASPYAAMQDAAVALLTRRWTHRLATVTWAADELPGVVRLVDAGGDIAARIAARAARLAQIQAPESVPLPEPGLSVCYGSADGAVVHADDHAFGEFDPFRHVAGATLWIHRRSQDADGTEHLDDWRVQCAGRLVCADNQGADVQSAPYAMASRVGFDRALHRGELRYDGYPLTAAHPLADAYDAVRDETEDQPLLRTVAAGPAAPFGLVPLRYGDTYDAAVSLVDEAGGHAAEVASADLPFELHADTATLTAYFAAHANRSVTQRYLRRVPVGDVNVVPADPKAGWPVLPSGIFLRAEEHWPAWLEAYAQDLPPAQHPGTPKLLLWAPEDGVVPAQSVATQYDLRLTPPSIDEHTLLRWALTPVGAAAATVAATTADLKRALLRCYDGRGAAGESPHAAVLAHDPAVSGIGVCVYRNAEAAAVAGCALAFTPSADPYLARPLTLSVRAVQRAAPLTATPTTDAHGATTGVVIEIPEGDFVYIMLHALVAPELMLDAKLPTTRFGVLRVPTQRLSDYHPPLVTQPLGNHRAFPGVPVFVEHMTHRLPENDALYAATRIDIDAAAGTARVYVDAVKLGSDVLPYVDRLVLEREVLAWRNLPWISDKLLEGVEKKDVPRRRASGLPDELGKIAQRDDPVLVDPLDRLLAVDGGFVRHAALARKWPRRKATGQIDCSVPIVSDDHDGDTRALYCRYALTVHSRYAPLLPTPTVSFPEALHRRAVVPYRGRLPHPPRVLAVIPLMSAPSTPGADAPAGPAPTPLLVLLDECWFREYGAGDRLVAHIEREPNDPGEDVVVEPDGTWTARENPRPYRIGPLPDHYKAATVADDTRYLLGRATAAQAADAPQALDVYGPFGYSFDETADQALASASAFLVTPPPQARPHFALSLRFARRLDFPSRGETSEFSGARSAYLLPDSRFLATGDQPSLHLQSSGTTLAATLAGDLRCWLDPVAGSANDTIGGPWHIEGRDGSHRLLNSDSGANYRYFLLFTDVVDLADGAERPLGLAQIPLFDPTANAGAARYRPFYRTEFGTGDSWTLRLLAPRPQILRASRARVIEVWLNGRIDSGPSPLDRIDTAAAFWRALMPDDELANTEPHGQLRRVSAPIALRFD